MVVTTPSLHALTSRRRALAGDCAAGVLSVLAGGKAVQETIRQRIDLSRRARSRCRGDQRDLQTLCGFDVTRSDVTRERLGRFGGASALAEITSGFAMSDRSRLRRALPLAPTSARLRLTTQAR